MNEKIPKKQFEIIQNELDQSGFTSVKKHSKKLNEISELFPLDKVKHTWKSQYSMFQGMNKEQMICMLFNPYPIIGFFYGEALQKKQPEVLLNVLLLTP